MALFLFLQARVALAFLPAAHFVALRPLFPFRQAQFAQVFLFKPAPFCNFSLVSVAPTSLPFLCLFSSSQTLALCSLRLFFYLKVSGTFGRNCLLSPPVLSGYCWCLDTRFFKGTTRLMSWPAGYATRALCSPLLSFTSRIHFFS